MTRTAARLFMVPIVLILACAIAGIACVGQAHADALVWHEVDMKPGDTYDVSEASSNTTVYITSKGDYTLKGESRNVRVLVESGGVNLYLADGLSINCSATSYTGSRTAAIWVKDVDGTIKVVSKKSASVYLEGYLCPAIRKEGTKSKLVFETEDESFPGTITAQAGQDSAGIGSVLYLSSGANTMGNITFNSGNIVAKGSGSGAGIGGGQYCDVTNIVINGGYVEAYDGKTLTGGGGGAAAIGCGEYARADGIVINGGEVYAESGYGAAIGAGVNPDYLQGDVPIIAQNIIVNGGNVTAKTESDGVAIGAGCNGGAKNIQINGGSVTAINSGVGPAIGCGLAYYNKPRESNVFISGGYIDARGGGDSPGIGAGKYDPQNSSAKPGDNSSYVEISGGTIVAKGGPDAKSDIGGPGEAKTVITGGSVYVDSNDTSSSKKGISGAVVNGDENPVRRMAVTCKSIPEGGLADTVYLLKDLKFLEQAPYTYGMNDVYLIREINLPNNIGMFYPWLPETDESGNIGKCQATLRTERISGAIEEQGYYGDLRFSGSSAPEGELNPGLSITLVDKNNEEGAKGFAAGVLGQDKLCGLNPPELRPGTQIDGYYTEDDVKVADEDGTLLQDVPGYTDESGKWDYRGEEKTLTLYCNDEPREYDVVFDGNRPRGASTQVVGQMAKMTLAFYAAESLPVNSYPDNGFFLPGYDFAGWNTKANGLGEPYADGAAIKNLAPFDDPTVTLYAQWRPKEYQLSLAQGTASGSQTASDSIAFDARATIPPIPSGWKDDLRDFHCWVDENGNYYDQGEDFCNLVRYDGNGKPIVLDSGMVQGQTLTALWVEHGRIAATVTIDGAPQAGHETDFNLISKSDPNKVYTPAFTYANGIYTYVSPSDEGDPDYVPPGEYTLSFDTGEQNFVASSKDIDYKLDATASVIFDYCTVSIDRDPAIVAIDDSIFSAEISGTGMLVPGRDNAMLVPDDAKLAIETNMNPDCGYHFDGYSVLGVTPGNSDNFRPFDQSNPNQTITVRGTAAITAHAEANVYTLHFDANAASGVSGEMEDQDMVYDQQQNLFANKFKRAGGTFVGWNTAKDGSGDSFTDKQSVKNLTVENGGEITLYAQWDMQVFKIAYDLAGGSLPPGVENPTTYTAATPSFTLNNPAKEDCDFSGWLGTGLSSPAQEVTVEGGSTGNRNYAAVFAIKQFTVKFEDNGGTGTDDQIVPIHHKAQQPDDPTRDGYEFKGWYADKELTVPFDFNTEITADITIYAKWATTEVPVLMAQGRPSGTNALKLSWNKVEGASKYVIYAAKCGHRNNLKRVKTTTKASFVLKKLNGKKLAAHKAYKFRIVALDKSGKQLLNSKTAHVITAKTMGKYANISKITAKKAAVALKLGKSTKVKATYKLPKGKKHISAGHCPFFRYTSNNPKVASVDKDGKVKANRPGKATIYIQDSCGKYCKTVVTVTR